MEIKCNNVSLLPEVMTQVKDRIVDILTFDLSKAVYSDGMYIFKSTSGLNISIEIRAILTITIINTTFKKSQLQRVP